MFKHSELDESINGSFIGCSAQFILNCTTLAGTVRGTVVASRLKVRPGNAWRKPRRSIRVCRLWAPWTSETADPMGDTPLDPVGNLLWLYGKSPLFWGNYLQMGHGLDSYVSLLEATPTISLAVALPEIQGK